MQNAKRRVTRIGAGMDIMDDDDDRDDEFRGQMRGMQGQRQRRREDMPHNPEMSGTRDDNDDVDRAHRPNSERHRHTKCVIGGAHESCMKSIPH